MAGAILNRPVAILTTENRTLNGLQLDGRRVVREDNYVVELAVTHIKVDEQETNAVLN